MGCPNMCVFCDQHAISGVSCFDRSAAEKTVVEHLASVPPDVGCEIAFFGGSFTGTDRSLMIPLLDMAERYVADGRVSGIRMSTRPDYISPEIISILKRYTVAAVELGVQSMSDRVLSLSRRGHTADDSRRAFYLLGEASIPTVGQMMIGLPGSSREDETDCARAICDMGAVGSRIYPTVVFFNTELCRMTERGEYIPLSVEDAVSRSADVLTIFEERGVRCLRIGLHGVDDLRRDGKAMAGPFHPSFGELVTGECYRRAIERAADALLDGGKTPGAITVYVPRGDLSAAIGHRGANREYFFSRFGFKEIDFVEKDSLLRYNIVLEEKTGHRRK